MIILPQPDRRCWRYRLTAYNTVDAKIFESPEVVPDGEGWKDSPALCVAVEEKHKPAKENAKGDAETAPKAKPGRPRNAAKPDAKGDADL
jgi:hypothetical protein